jgi:hypothetical protein
VEIRTWWSFQYRHDFMHNSHSYTLSVSGVSLHFPQTFSRVLALSLAVCYLTIAAIWCGDVISGWRAIYLPPKIYYPVALDLENDSRAQVNLGFGIAFIYSTWVAGCRLGSSERMLYDMSPRYQRQGIIGQRNRLPSLHCTPERHASHDTDVGRLQVIKMG